MVLTVKERLQLLLILPSNEPGKLPALRLYHQFRQDLSFSEKEHQEFKVVMDGDLTHWDPAVSQEREIEVGEVAHKWVVQTMKRMEAAEPSALTLDLLPLYDKFCPEKET